MKKTTKKTTKRPPKVAKAETTKVKTTKAVKTAKEPKAMTAVDAAAKVLSEYGKPLHSRGILERMLAQGLWKTASKAPCWGLFASIEREIATKGKDSRFRKVGRGEFEAVKKTRAGR